MDYVNHNAKVSKEHAACFEIGIHFCPNSADISSCLDQKKFDFIVKVVGENITSIPGVTEKLHVRSGCEC